MEMAMDPTWGALEDAQHPRKLDLLRRLLAGENAVDPAMPEQPYEVWARIKFEGPSFPYAKPGDSDAIYVERLVLVRTTVSACDSNGRA